MDGLLIDSEPLWYEAALKIMADYGVSLDEKEYAMTIGLRTKEFLDFWFTRHGISADYLPVAETDITDLVIAHIRSRGELMPGAESIISFFKERNFKVGLATSSPQSIVDAMFFRTGLRDLFDECCSAEKLPYGKPHPQVYLNCVEALKSNTSAVICFEDSFNGMIAAKAAKLSCVVVPDKLRRYEWRWLAADYVLDSLSDFNDEILQKV